MPLTVVIPMAGMGSRFRDYGFRTEKYLLPVNLKMQTMLDAAIHTLGAGAEGVKYVFIVRGDVGVAALRAICAARRYEYEIVSVPQLTEGPAASVAAARHVIDADAELIVSNSDQIMDWSFDRFLDTCRRFDGCVLTYTPPYPLTLGEKDKHSFVQLAEEQRAIAFAEKVCLSEHALVGVHYYRAASMFFDAFDWMVDTNTRADNGEFYLSLSYNAMLAKNRKVGRHALSEDERFHPVGEPADYFDYLYRDGGYVGGHRSVSDHETLLRESWGSVAVVRYHPGSVVHVRGIAAVLEGACEDDYQIFGEGDVLSFPEGRTVFARSSVRVAHVWHDAMTTDAAVGVFKVRDYTRGWLVGDFQPAVFRTRDFEIGVMSHRKGEACAFHYHAHMVEINVLAKGAMLVNERPVKQHDLFVLQKNQVVAPRFLEDCCVVCVKVPSVKGDKVLV